MRAMTAEIGTMLLAGLAGGVLGVLFFGGVAVDTAGEDDDGDDGDYYEEDQDEDEDY